jgi:hypothetical protein
MKRIVMAAAVLVAVAVGSYAMTAHATNCTTICNQQGTWCSTNCY